MAILKLKAASFGALPMAVLSVLLLISLYLMGEATRNSEEFGRLYIVLLAINIFGLVTLVTLIAANLVRLVRQHRQRVVGARLTVRLLVAFTLITLVPVSVVYYFSMDFIRRGIDSWFDVRFERGFDDALELSRISLDERKRDYLRRTNQLGGTLSLLPNGQADIQLSDMRSQSDAWELTLLGANGHIIAFSSANPLALLPNLPSETVLRQVRQGTPYVGVDPIGDYELYIRVVLELPVMSPTDETRFLQALFPVSSRMNELAASVDAAASGYKQLAYLRAPLKYSFELTLSLVLLLTLLFALWAAFYSARRLVAPVRVLAMGTRAVAAGDYDRQLPQHSSDELGFLVKSFNDMTRRLAQARDEARLSQEQAEGERAYLSAVLGRLSSGVITLDAQGAIRTANAAAAQILGVELGGLLAKPLARLGDTHEHVKPFIDTVIPQFADNRGEWRREAVIYGPAGRQVLICGGAPLSTADQSGGKVLVFEDVTALVQAQRDAAWGEVARRLAHEIKNPLTPIRLSAERMRRKYLGAMAPEEADILDRSTHTIVKQVEVMEEMVKAFSEYARTPQLRLQSLDLNVLINEVLDLYRGDAASVRFATELDPGLPRLRVDAGRIRQLLHNLIKNSIEAAQPGQACVVSIRTARTEESTGRTAELRVQDNGPGLPPEMLGGFFEPHFSTKRRGSGLGLAIVKKIVEEHGGSVTAENAAGGGAVIIVRFPLDLPVDAAGGEAEESAAGRRPAAGVIKDISRRAEA
jgi:nitrogen fixation/metabolism regulation signal transduction histidine kinase